MVINTVIYMTLVFNEAIFLFISDIFRVSVHILIRELTQRLLLELGQRMNMRHLSTCEFNMLFL